MLQRATAVAAKSLRLRSNIRVVLSNTLSSSTYLSSSSRPCNKVSFNSVRSLCTTTADTETKTSELQNPENDILDAALSHVNTHGWTIEALAAGATDLGYPSVAHGMFPRGPIELVEHFMKSQQARMRQELADSADTMEEKSVHERLANAIKNRLEGNIPVLEKWPEAMALGALPQNAPNTVTSIASLADDIWYHGAGDRSTSVAWYTKRAVITGVYVSTELFMLTDKSEGFVSTWEFLDDRLKEAAGLGDVPSNAQQAASMVGLGLNSIVSAATSLAAPVLHETLRKSPLHSIIASNQAAAGDIFKPPSDNMTEDIDAEVEKFGGKSSDKE